ncbi:MAG: hypothetical protein WBN56_10685 [Robiginitalea sp.]|uniref:hypothetical protein n=1 Tax=Robiginitalea sp. TaxID=1902411 RepID=UPI003C7907BF
MKPINLYLKNVLFRTSLLAIFILAFSCSQDTSSGDLDGAETLNAVEARAGKTRPIKGQLDFSFDYSNDLNIVSCGVPGVALFKTIVSGNMSHLGNLQPGSEFDEVLNEPVIGSYLIPISCQIVAPPPAVVLNAVYRSVYVAANGDELHATENVLLTFMSERAGTFVGTVTIDGGTGRFKDATGTWNTNNGIFDASVEGNTASWEIEGEISY